MADARAVLQENIVENKETGERFVFKETSSREVCAFDFFVAPGGGIPMLHCHASQSEVFRVRAGHLTVLGVKGERVIGPGEELHLAPGELHAFANRGDVEVECEVEYRPAGRSFDWLRVVNAPVALGEKAPSLLDIAPFIGDVDMFIAGPPIAAQRALYAVLGAVGTLFGTKKAMLAKASRVYGRELVW